MLAGACFEDQPQRELSEERPMRVLLHEIDELLEGLDLERRIVAVPAQVGTHPTDLPSAATLHIGDPGDANLGLLVGAAPYWADLALSRRSAFRCGR